MKMNTRFGRIMYGISLVVSVGIIAVVWLVIQPGVVFSVLFTLFVLAIDVYNGRKAFGVSPEPR
ncbi:hypothetical protein [Frigoribacterium sp. ACAM 257]|uniref:hypothetical protein n=1 Tax=Frigoribacterium sp. ACAM 257 TaxID=2508998 RepID=UPI00174C2A4C|nr:hypothetical protein [Frigoribacterium sp. ACAM 257]